MWLTKPQHHIVAKRDGDGNYDKDNKDFNFNTHFLLTPLLLLELNAL